MRILTLVLLSTAFLAACGGTSSTGLGGDAGVDATTDGGNPPACPGSQPTAGTACCPNGLECTYSPNPACSGYWDCTGGTWRQTFPGVACMPDSGPMGGNCHGTSDVIHRAQATACPSHVGADAGCGITPHDQCLMDADCGPGYVCQCEAPIAAGQPCPGGVPAPSGNVCIASTCLVDADCPACGVCQAQYTCNQVGGYHCQTPTDECYPSASGATGINACTWASGQWTLTGPVACPG